MSFIALIDYGMGNLMSVSKALEYVGGKIRVVDTPSDAEGASGVILPGVGNFGDGMEHLNRSGFVPFIRETVRRNVPFLGICLGMQMLLESSEEAPGVPGTIPADLKIPQIGWNSIRFDQDNPFLKGLRQDSFFYFVHSYYALPDDPSVTAARCTYMIDFAAALSKGNVFAAQFHPEKSQDCGLAILRNFVTICGKDVSGTC